MAKRVGVIYHPKITRAKEFMDQLLEFLPTLGVSAWSHSAWDEEGIKKQLKDADVAISVGGDGTLLRVGRAAAVIGTPIIGINLGKLGFTTELKAGEAREKLPQLLSGEGWTDERTMLQAEIHSADGKKSSTHVFHALNDVVMGRGRVSRVVYITVEVEGAPLTRYKVDGIILCTATGSTGYNLATGGPIIYPQAKEFVLNPISPHLGLQQALVLSSDTTIELEIRTDHEAMLSIDGQIDIPLQDNDRVRVMRSPYTTRLLRIHPTSHFYDSLESRLRG